MSGRYIDSQGFALLLGDSQAASQHYGFDGVGLRNVPKSKFMFFSKFHRARGTGGSDWEKGMGFVLKSLDRPRVSFQTETLNQYNRKRIVQTNHEFESVMFKFHDTVLEDVQRMFEEYYDYYFNEPRAYTDPTTYDVVRSEWDPANPFGLKAIPIPEGFFSHITVYQIFNRSVSIFELINPKIQQFNPDELDYANSGASEIVMNVEFEGIKYLGVQPITEDMIREMGIDRTRFYDIFDTPALPAGDENSSINIPSRPERDPFDQAGDILERQILRGIAGEGFSIRSLGQETLNSFDKNRGLVTAKLGARALGDLLKGRTDSGAVQAIRRLPLYGRPGRLF